MTEKYTNTQQRRDAFYKAIEDRSVDSLKLRGLDGNLKDYTFRSVIWKIFFGIVDLSKDPSEWASQMRESRLDYQARLEKNRVDPYKLEEVPAVINNPLSQDKESPWMQYFHDEEIRKSIIQDIKRTYPDNEYFQSEDVRSSLLNILFIHAREHPNVGYKQGMHELLAPILFLVDREKIDISQQSSTDPFFVLLDSSYVEADAASIFFKLMETCQSWFTVEETKKSPTNPSLGSSLLEKAPSEEEPMSVVVRKCHRIHHLHLKQKDKELYDYFEHLKIEPQLYALRWIRLLFGREFHLEDVLTLWDGIFSSNISTIVEYISVAMLIYIRHEIIGREYVIVMKRLFKYPPVEDVNLFLHQAVRLRDPYYNPISRPQLAPPPVVKSETPQPNSQRQQYLQQQAGTTKPSDPLTSRVKSTPVVAEKHKEPFVAVDYKSPFKKTGRATTGEIVHSNFAPAPQRSIPEAMNSSSPSTNQAGVIFGLKRENDRLRNLHMELSDKLDEAINVLQDELVSKKPEPYNEERIFYSIAELKRVKDLLSHRLDDDEPIEIAPLEASSQSQQERKGRRGKAQANFLL